MHPSVQGDFENFPKSLQAELPRVWHSVLQLKQGMIAYRYLFMEERSRTETMGESLGGVLGWTQGLLEEWIILAIARMLDKPNGKNKNLNVRHIYDIAIDDPFFESDHAKLKNLWIKTEALEKDYAIAKFRNKTIAHTDEAVALGKEIFPEPIWSQLDETATAIEEIVTLIWEKCQGMKTQTVIDPRDICWKSEKTVYKAKAYDRLTEQGVINGDEWHPMPTQ